MIRRGGPDDAQSFDDAWTSGDLSGATPDTTDLVRTAELLCRSAVAEPAAQFRDDLRTRLMVEAADVLVVGPVATVAEPPSRSVPAATGRPVRRRLVGLTAAAVTGLGTVGMISSSATAVPGDVLYPVKRGVESVQLALHRGDTSRGEFQLGQARERLAEAWWLDSNGKDGRVADALDTFSAQASEGSMTLFTAYGDQDSAATIDTVNDFAADATVTLTKMSDDLPEDAQTALDAAADTVTGLAAQASSLCPTCTAADLSSLLDAVDDAVGAAPAAPTTPRDSGSGSDPEPSSGSAATPPPRTPGSGSGSTTAPKVPQPAPTPTVVPNLKDLTDPLLGGLLGDDDDEGLLPGLLGGKK